MRKDGFNNESTYKNFLEAGNEEEFDRLFDQAAADARRSFGLTHPLYINGKAETSSEKLTERSPIDRNVVMGVFQKATREQARMAVNAARLAFERWRELGYEERANIFSNAADLFSERKFAIAAILSYENGKSRYESIGEVDEAVDFMRYYAKEIVSNKGYNRKIKVGSSTAKVSMGFQGAPAGLEVVEILMKPYGVFGVIAPFNFPVSISTGMSIGAMITGNTVVFKPSCTDNMTMLTGLKIYELLTEAGLPNGVFNYITGQGSEIGDELVKNPDVSGIVFTGSRSTGLSMVASSLNLGLQKCFVVEMGGKNPAIVSKSADIEKAVDGITSSAFGFSGQKCSALSRVYIHESIREQFISRLIEKTRSLKIGNPIEKANYIGPLISESAYRRYVEVISKAKLGGKIIYGGNKVSLGLEGYYVEPVVIELRHDNELMHRELFLPVLGVCSYSDFSDAIKKANDTEYGLTAGLYSNNRSEINEFKNRIDAGVVYINRSIGATTGAIVGLHAFVGWKGSGLTCKGTGSKFYLQQFLKEQSISTTK